jgi:two-component system sensor histidine kinase/response regulator
MSTLIKFLNDSVNKSIDINDILMLYQSITSCENYIVYINYDNKNTFTKLLNKNFINLPETISITNNYINIVIKNKDDHSDFFIHKSIENINYIYIPILSDKIILGIILLENNKKEIENFNIKEKINELIVITQLTLLKYQYLYTLDKYYADDKYFTKDLFLANISHEIRTPLNGIIGYSQLLIQTPVNDIQKTYIKSLTQCGLQLMQIINDILDFSRLANGKMKLNIECFSLTELCSIVIDALSNQLKDKKQTCEFKFISPLPTMIVMDKQKLIQILINLIGNSIKFSPINSSIFVYIYNNLNILKCEIIDNGIGISDIDQCKIFNSFIQLNNNNIIDKKGSGLGLAISKKLVELLGGDIFLKSKLNVGSTFTFTCFHVPYDEYEKNIDIDKKILKDKFILVVDDNPNNRLLICDLLFQWDMKPIICASGLEALHLININRYNFELALIDICMPDMSGTQLAEQIKNERPFFPLIALSSIDSYSLGSYFEYKLEKPFKNIQLFNCIYNVILNNINNNSNFNPMNNSNEFDNSINILIAEDVNYNQVILVNMLESLNYKNISIANNGKETIDLIDKSYKINKPFDILLLDIRMPILDGFEVILYMKTKNYNLPKIIVITASVMYEDQEKCKELGIEHYILKPIQLKDLHKKILQLSKKT